MISHLGDDAAAGVSVANQIVVVFYRPLFFHRLRLQCGDRITSAQAIATVPGMSPQCAGDQCLAWSVNQHHDLTVFPDRCWGYCIYASLLPYARPFLALMGGTLFLEADQYRPGCHPQAHAHTKQVMVVALGMNVINIALNAVLRIFRFCSTSWDYRLGCGWCGGFNRHQSCAGLHGLFCFSAALA